MANEKMSSGNVMNPNIGFPHALLISASAGSGKTYTLAQRYAMFLLGDRKHESSPMRPENIIAVTFTNNAAKEMKQRILKYLKDLALGKNPDAEKVSTALGVSSEQLKEISAKKVSELLDSYSDFQVQTIDSFFSGIFRLSASELNYPPDMETIFSSSAITDAGVAALLSLAGKPGVLDQKSSDWLLENMPKKTAFQWNPAEAIRDAFDGFLGMESALPHSISIPEEDEKSVDRIFKQVKKDLAGIYTQIPEEFIREKMRDLDSIRTPSDLIVLYSSGTFGFFDGHRKRSILNEIPNAMDIVGRVNAEVCELVEAYSKAYYRPYMRIYDIFREKTEMIKRKMINSIPISDISKKLSDYISRYTVPEIYYNLGSRLNHFMIDEFQDTSRLQWNVMLPLIEEALSSRGSLFLVGDIKQAIYRFRYADYKIMSSLMQNSSEAAHGLNTSMLPYGLEIENLPLNYRSGGVITDYVYDVFRKRLPLLLSHYNLRDFTGLTSYQQQPKTENIGKGYVRCQIIDTSTEDWEEDYRNCLVSTVREAMKRHSCRDIALLVNRNADVEDTVALLSSENIPSASYSSLDIRKRPVIMEILSLLQFLDKPFDDLAFFSFVNGEIFARTALPPDCSLNAELAKRPRGEMLYVYFRNSDKFSTCWNEYFDPLFRKSGYLPLYELVCHIYDLYALFDNFPTEQAALAKFQEVVASVAGKGINTIGAFLEYADISDPDEDSKTAFAVAMPEALDAIQVMTWHKSKGLGFPVVINVIQAKRKRSGSGIGFYEGKDGIYPFYSVANLEKLSDFLKNAKLVENIEELVQSLNTMYVICTRAKEELYNIVLREPKNDRNTPVLPDFSDIFDAYQAGTVDSSKKVSEEKADSPLKAISGQKDRQPLMNPYPASMPEGDSIQRSRGELIHAVIAKFAKKAENDKDLHTVIGDIYDEIYPCYFAEKGLFSKEEDIEMIVRFITDRSVNEFFAKNVETETLVEEEFIDSFGNLLRMDMVRITSDCVSVIDFKTGRPHTEKYRRQLLHYMRTLGQVYGRQVKGYIAYINPVHVVEIT